MKNFIPAVALTAALFSSSSAFAGGDGGCHFHGDAPAKDTVVVGCATEYKDALVASGKLEPSWQAVKADKAEVGDGKSAKEWRVTFNNPAAKEAGKKTLYMFFSLPGNLIGANFSGK